MSSVLVIIKPDAVENGSTESIISDFEAKGFKIKHRTQITPSIDIVKQHYIEHENKDFYNDLCSFMVSGPVVILYLELLKPKGKAVEVARGMLKDLRKEYGTDFRRNAIHISDSNLSTEREFKLWSKYLDV